MLEIVSCRWITSGLNMDFWCIFFAHFLVQVVEGHQVLLPKALFSSFFSLLPLVPRVATSDTSHFVTTIKRHKALLSHFAVVFSHCTLSLILVLLGQSQPNFRLLSITWLGLRRRQQRPAVSFEETKSSVTVVPENHQHWVCVNVCLWDIHSHSTPTASISASSLGRVMLMYSALLRVLPIHSPWKGLTA